MHLIAILGILLFAAFASAASQASDTAFEITNLQIRKVATGNVTIDFTVYDPDPLSNATHSCAGSWKAGSDNYPKGSYASCGNSTFDWNMQSFDNIHSFVLGIEHTFEDASVGEPPYDEITNFAKANITKPDITCKATSGLQICEQSGDTAIKAPIYATIAKRR